MPTDPARQYQGLISLAAGQGLPEDWFALGCTLHDAKRWGAASGCFARAIGSASENGSVPDRRAWCNLGWNLHLSGRSGEGLAALRRSIEIAPSEGTPRALMSQVLATLGRGAEAIVEGRLGIEYEPGIALNHVALSLALMSAGEWREGWERYEHRFSYKIPEFTQRPYRLWRGEQVGHLYIECEQGVGDSIFGLRWLWEAARRAGRVTVYVQAGLFGLFRDALKSAENVSVLPMPRPLPNGVEAWSPMLSLPVALDMPDPTLVMFNNPAGAYIPRPLGAMREAGFHVGIVWAGSAEHEQAHHRDCSLPYWMPLTELPGVTLHSLQIGARSQDLSDAMAHGLIRDRAPEITSFRDTAEIIAGLDLVIAVDTAVAHLAGAMGVPCWLLLNQRGRDFRWGYTGDRTPWYPSHRLLRRSLGEDWAAVMRRVVDDLLERVG